MKFYSECACSGTAEDCPIGDCDCEGQLRVNQDCTEARWAHTHSGLINLKIYTQSQGSVSVMALMRQKPAMTGGSCMLTTPPTPTPGCGCAGRMTVMIMMMIMMMIMIGAGRMTGGAPGPSRSAATATPSSPRAGRPHPESAPSLSRP